jgi:hypothetical protein
VNWAGAVLAVIVYLYIIGAEATLTTDVELGSMLTFISVIMLIPAAVAAYVLYRSKDFNRIWGLGFAVVLFAALLLTLLMFEFARTPA